MHLLVLYLVCLTSYFRFSLALRTSESEMTTESTSNTPRFQWSRIKYVYAFGDSYSYVGGTRGHTNFSFIGDKLDLAFTPEELLMNEILPRKTSSDGSNWLQFLTGCFQGSPLKCPIQLWDFAFAGADIDGDLLPLHHDFTVPLVDQVDQWIQYASHIIPHPKGETLTAWWIGINDTGDTKNNSTITNFEAFWNLEMTSYFRAVDKASQNGLNTHLFLNIPSRERSPSSLNNPGNLKENTILFNQILSNHIDNYKSTHPDDTVILFDAHAWFNKVLDNPTNFGFTNTTGFCTCPNPTGYFWYDGGHPTEHVHQLLARAIKGYLDLEA